MSQSNSQTNLPSFRQRSKVPASVQKCGGSLILGVNKDSPTAIVISTKCKSWWCPRCRVPKALTFVELVCAGDPERMLTLTCNPERCVTKLNAIDVMKAGWVRLLRQMRKMLGPTEYVLIWECTKRGWPHIHIAQRGPYVPHAWLKYWWNQFTGAPIVHIQKIKNQRHAARYIAKYFVKSQVPMLRLLGGRRLYQVSRKWALRAVKSPLLWKSSDFTWFRLPHSPGHLVSEFKRLHHLLLNPQGKEPTSWFLLSEYDIIPGTDGLTFQDLKRPRPPPIIGNMPPGAPPVQRNVQEILLDFEYRNDFNI